jgi:HAE1 family hydrophobic/amphiphilic exporter-1
MAHPRTVLVGVRATIVFSASLFSSIPKGFLPSGDSGQITASTEGAQDISLPAMVERQRAVAAIVAQDPNVRSFMSSVGGGGPRPTANTGSLNLMLKPRGERELSADEIIQQLRPKLAAVPGIRVYMQNPPPIRIGGQQTSRSINTRCRSTDLKELYHWTDTLLGASASCPVSSTSPATSTTSARSSLEVDRDKIAARAELRQVEDALQSAFSARQISTIYGAAPASIR